MFLLVLLARSRPFYDILSSIGNWGYQGNFKLFNFFYKNILSNQKSTKMQTSNFLPLKCFLCAQKRKQLSSPWIFFMHIKMLPFRFLFACLLFVCSKSFCKKIKKPEITLIPSITYTTKLKVFFKPLWFKFKKINVP